MAAAFGIQHYLNIRAANGPSFSPDGRFLAFLTNVTGVPQLWQLPVRGGWPVQLTFTGEVVRGAYYNPQRHEILFTADVGGNERTQIFHLHGVAGATEHGLGDGWNARELTLQPQSIHSFGGWSNDGRRFAFAANREEAGRFDIYVQDLGESKARLLRRGPGGYYQPIGWSPDDKTLLVYQMESNARQHLFLLDAATGAAKALTKQEADAQYHSPCWSADGQSVYCASTAGGRDLTGLAKLDIASGTLRFLETPEHEVEAVAASNGGRWLAWLLNVEGKSELKLRDLRNNRVYSPRQLPLGVVSGLTFARDDNRLAFVFDGPQNNQDVWTWDLQHLDTAPQQLTHSSRAGIPVSRLAIPELIHYSTFDGRSIPAWFYKPRTSGGRPPPVIVYPHGGPESQSRANFNALFQFFVERGYAILAPNVRGSSGYGTAYMNLDNTVKRMDSVADLAHAAYWLRDNKQGDPRKLVVYGGSYGGFMVLAAVTHYPDLWAAGIDVVGICNFATFMERTGPYRRAHREAEYGNLREHRALFERISPIHHVDKIRCPMMVIHGANDPRVPIHEAEQIVAALRTRSIPVEYIRYEDEGHGVVKLKNKLDVYPRMTAFLDKYVPT